MCGEKSKQQRENSRTLWHARSRPCGTTSSSKPRMQIFCAKLWLWPPPNRRQIARLPHSIFRQSPMQPPHRHRSPANNSKYFRSLSWRALLQIAPSSTAALGRAVPLAVKTLRNVMSTASCAPWWSGEALPPTPRQPSHHWLAPQCPCHATCRSNAQWLQPRGTLWRVSSLARWLGSSTCLNGSTLRGVAPDNPTSHERLTTSLSNVQRQPQSLKDRARKRCACTLNSGLEGLPCNTCDDPYPESQVSLVCGTRLVQHHGLPEMVFRSGGRVVLPSVWPLARFNGLHGRWSGSHRQLNPPLDG